MEKTSHQIPSTAASDPLMLGPVSSQNSGIYQSPVAQSSVSSNFDYSPISTTNGGSQAVDKSVVPPPLRSNSAFIRDGHPLNPTSPSEIFSITRRIGDVSIDGEVVNELFKMSVT